MKDFNRINTAANDNYSDLECANAIGLWSDIAEIYKKLQFHISQWMWKTTFNIDPITVAKKFFFEGSEQDEEISLNKVHFEILSWVPKISEYFDIYTGVRLPNKSNILWETLMKEGSDHEMEALRVLIYKTTRTINKMIAEKFDLDMSALEISEWASDVQTLSINVAISSVDTKNWELNLDLIFIWWDIDTFVNNNKQRIKDLLRLKSVG